MAKSEHTTNDDVPVSEPTTEKQVYDVEAALREDLSKIPDQIELEGRWLLQFRGGELYTKPGWMAVNLFFQPIHPVDGQSLSTEELEDLPSLRYRQFYVRKQDKRRVRSIFEALDIEIGPLGDMIEDGRGEYCTAIVSLGTDFRGDPEYKLSSFQPGGGEYEIPFEIAAE